jgi:hypothetical protein
VDTASAGVSVEGLKVLHLPRLGTGSPVPIIESPRFFRIFLTFLP